MRHLPWMVGRKRTDDLIDAQLVQRYVTGHGVAAFEALLGSR
jgi:hypothetical protein